MTSRKKSAGDKDDFESVARRLGWSDDKATFERKLGRIAASKPPVMRELKEQPVKVGRKVHSVSTKQKTRERWVAVGEHDGEWLQGEGATEAQAIEAWMTLARGSP